MKNILIIIAAVAAAFFVGYCNRPNNLEKILVKSDTIYQDTGTHSVVFKTQISKEFYTDTVWKTQQIDTLAILADYFLTRVYDSTFVLPNEVEISYSGLINKNRLSNFEISAKNKRATVVNEAYYTEPNERQIEYLGGFGVFKIADKYGLKLIGGVGNDKGMILIEANPLIKYYSLDIVKKF